MLLKTKVKTELVVFYVFGGKNFLVGQNAGEKSACPSYLQMGNFVKRLACAFVFFQGHQHPVFQKNMPLPYFCAWFCQN
jgi:hypothetical protein